jgi:hypothetical protein
MNKLIFFFFLSTIFSCKKNNNCQECKTFGTVNGIDYGIPPNQKSETWCDGSPIPSFKDASGNQLNSICR